MSEKKFQRFGKYLILDHLVDGGMAKICRARYLGEQANKVVAIKMVQPQFSNDEAFMRMFQDELNITFSMLHPNIMQVYDYGKTNGQLYTAMEYIHGANLKQYLDRLKEKKKAFPVESSCYIISQVCLGLHYAHTFTDKLTGKPYNIVHRDISPHNIMLTYDGAVKVIDFGIAKAETNSEATQAGTIKGKLSYLAPEYLDGLELDARYDEFAVGITLWELLCSRKLFQAPNDLAVLKQIQACKITPPSEINPTVPKELDAIVMKALSKDRANRYENLDQLNRALVRFLYSTYPEFNPSDLRDFADDLFAKELTADQEKFVEYGKIDITPYIDEMRRDEYTGKIGKKEAVPQPREQARVLEFSINDSDKSLGIEIDNRTPGDFTATKTRKLPKSIAPGKGAKDESTGTLNIPMRPEKTLSRVLPRREAKRKEDSSGSPPPIVAAIVVVASLTGFVYFQPDLVEKLTGIKVNEIVHGKPSRNISSVPNMDKKGELKGKIILSGLDVSMHVFVDGNKIDWGRPIQVPLNRKVNITIKKRGYTPYTASVNLTPEANSKVITIPTLERSRLGLLTTSNNYTAGSKLVYEEAGEPIERSLPFKDVRIPEGTYQAKVINPILGTEKKIEFTIEENKKHFLE